MADDVQRTNKPHNRLTRICDQMTQTFDRHPEHLPDDRCIVFLDSDTDRMGGIVVHGYDDDRQALVNLLMHVKAMFASMGMHIDLMTLDDDGIDRA